MAAANSSEDQGVRICCSRACQWWSFLTFVSASLPFGWLIPIAIFFVISFPPVCIKSLFGCLFFTHNALVVWPRNPCNPLRRCLGLGRWLCYCCCWDVHRRARQLLVCLSLPLFGVRIIEPSFSAFRYCCRSRGEKLEKTDLQYGCLAETVRKGGFKIALIARYSAIPGHCELHRFRKM